MNVFIAGNESDAPFCADLAAEIESLDGMKVVSTWHTMKKLTKKQKQASVNYKANKTMKELVGSSVLVYVAPVMIGAIPTVADLDAVACFAASVAWGKDIFVLSGAAQQADDFFMLHLNEDAVANTTVVSLLADLSELIA